MSRAQQLLHSINEAKGPEFRDAQITQCTVVIKPGMMGPHEITIVSDLSVLPSVQFNGQWQLREKACDFKRMLWTAVAYAMGWKEQPFYELSGSFDENPDGILDFTAKTVTFSWSFTVSGYAAKEIVSWNAERVQQVFNEQIPILLSQLPGGASSNLGLVTEPAELTSGE